MKKIKLGISACLLGQKVRYDGGHRLDRYLSSQLGQFIDFVPVCPEVECGLPVPREAMRLVGEIAKPRLITQKTGIDYTGQLNRWISRKLPALEKQNLCGFVFKSKSPSSGMQGVKVYSKSGASVKKSAGLFAKAFMDSFPLIPVEDDSRLYDDQIRDNFIERVFILSRWNDLCASGKSLHDLVQFHTTHKLIIMAHSPKTLKELGGIVAEGKQTGVITLFNKYIKILMSGLKQTATVKKHTSVLYHMNGYLKNLLAVDEKREVANVIDRYHKGLVPLIVPITLMNHYVKKYKITYLANQVYLNPHPYELLLRNHV